MDAQSIIAKRIAGELRAGMLVNLGIGIPTMVANYRADGHHGVLSVGERPDRNRPDSRRGDGDTRANGRRRTSGDRIAGRAAHSTARCRSASFAADTST